MKIALIAPPWPLFNRPSIQVAALKAYLASELDWAEAVCFHPYLQVAQMLGPEEYDLISKSGWASEAVCGSLLFPEIAEKSLSVFERALERRGGKGGRGLFESARRAVQATLSGLAEERLGDFDAVAMTVSLNQLTAALYTAREIKRRWADKPVVIGGAGLAGPFGAWVQQSFREVDYVVQGEGELPLASLLEAIRKGERWTAFKAQVKSLATLPYPDFSDFFDELASQPIGYRFNPVIPLEASRGCWWGRCNFCNLNLQWKGYRAKGPARTVAELLAMARRFRVLDFAFMDNVLPRRECLEMFQQLASAGMDLCIFAEIRAVYSREEVATMAKGGLRKAQVGIEALSTPLLKRLGKGIRLMDNMAIMRHLCENGIRLGANLIVHFPGSTREEAEETLAAMEYAWPFGPLKTVSFWLGDGCPVSRAPRSFGIRSKRPHRLYQGIFPHRLLGGLAPLIWEYAGDLGLQRRIWRPVERRAEEWRARWIELGRRHGKLLTFRDGGDFLVIKQVRPDGFVLHHRLPSLARSVYLYCLNPRPIAKVLEKFGSRSRHRLVEWMNEMIRKRLMFSSDKQMLSLAVSDSNMVMR